MAAPTNVRVEAVAQGQTMVRWTYGGASNVKVYRSTDGASYSVVATIAPGTTQYNDTGLANKTKYWYKLSDDNGSTFSSVVTVVTYVVSTNRKSKADFAPLVAKDDLVVGGGFNDAVIQLNEEINTKNVQSTPCPLCLNDGALVIDCTSGCEWFQVVVDQDINSISLLGCDDCPNIDFVIPPSTTHGICGWPDGCDYQQDECYTSPIPGGTHGRTAKTNGLSYDGYGPSPTLNPSDCPCLSALDLAIKCCSANCTLNCSTNTEITLRACGGLGPYSWSSSGCTLSNTTGTKTKASINTGPSTSGLFPGEAAFSDVHLKLTWDNSLFGDICANSDPTASFIVNDWGNQGYDCYGVATGAATATGWPTPSTAGNATVTVTHPGDCNNNPISKSDSTSSFNDISIDSNPDPDLAHGHDIQVAIAHTQNHGGNNYSGSRTFTNDIINTVETYPGYFDMRTAAMVAAGCLAAPCDPTGAFVTLTDSAGVSVSLVVG